MKIHFFTTWATLLYTEFARFGSQFLCTAFGGAPQEWRLHRVVGSNATELDSEATVESFRRVLTVHYGTCNLRLEYGYSNPVNTGLGFLYFNRA